MRWGIRRCRRCTGHFVPTAESPEYCLACATALEAVSHVPWTTWLTPLDLEFLKQLRIKA